jgi:glutamate decarboxylase
MPISSSPNRGITLFASMLARGISPSHRLYSTSANIHRQDLHEMPYSSRYETQIEVPKYKMPERGVDSAVVYQLLHDELLLDGNPNMNLASCVVISVLERQLIIRFVHTWVPKECDQLMVENINKVCRAADRWPNLAHPPEPCRPR